MAGNKIGTLFTLTSFGESHGKAIGGVVDGCPSLLSLSIDEIQRDLDRRRPGKSKYTTARDESDEIEILSGVMDGKTTGASIGLLIKNRDQKSSDYDKFKNLYRPGHADFTYQQKYGIRDHRGGGRSSARETAIRVAAGAIAKQCLTSKYGISIRACVMQIGSCVANSIDWQTCNQNPLFWPDSKQVDEVAEYLDAIRKNLDSVGAMVLVEAIGVPIGLGEPVFDRLDADLAKAMISINASKGVEFGDGFSSVESLGSAFRDPINQDGFTSNHAGGMLGGISNGEAISLRVAFKPTSSIPQEIDTISHDSKPTTVKVTGRHDPCVGIRAVPICEAMAALVLMDHALRYEAVRG